MSTRDMQSALRSLGWDNVTVDGSAGPVTNQAVQDFQRGYCLGPWLSIDGVCGPQTWAAMENSLHNGGKASPHFAFNEFRCHGPVEGGCRRIWVVRDLLWSLEQYRPHVGSVTVVSGCRCPAQNRRVGGAANSQHQYGGACDIPCAMSTSGVRNLGLFAGIGYQGSNGLVRHVDRRDVSGANTTGASRGNPTIWRYA